MEWNHNKVKTYSKVASDKMEFNNSFTYILTLQILTTLNIRY